MNWLVSIALRFRTLVVAAALTLIVIGIRTADDIPLDVFPEFAPPKVEIQTEAPGLSTEEVESLVTVPIENSLAGIPFLDHVRSKSVLGLSSVQLFFAHGTDLIVARQLVGERLALSGSRLPQAVSPPVILPPLSSLSRAMKIGLSSEQLSQMDLTVLSKWTIRPRLMAIPGVANVAIWGDYDKQLQVLVDPDRLRTHGVTLARVMQSVGKSVEPISGGFIDTPNQRLAVRHTAAVSDPAQLANTVVAFRNGTPLLLGDVAEVRIGSPPPIGDAIINDVPGILLIVEKQPWANTLEVTRGVETAMKQLAPALPGVDVDTRIFRPATFIERALKNLAHSLVIGCVLVMVVLAVFLYDWRAALISSMAIPLSLLAAVLVLYYRGGTVNTMVLAGLIIALGEVVDDAVIDVENILRRLRLNHDLEQPKSSFRVVLDASLEVRSAVVYATLIIVLMLVPVFFLDGLAGSFFRPLAASYVLAIVASLVVALTVTPAMSLILLPRTARRQRRDTPLTALLKRGYAVLLRPLIHRPKSIASFVVVVFVGAGASVPYLGEELMPKFMETDFLMHWVEKPGIGVDAMKRITIAASRELRSVDGVNNFGSHIGRAEVADEVYGPNFTELWISIDTDVDYEETVGKVQETVDGYPGLYRDLLTYLTERIKEVLTGASGAIVVRVYGPNLEELRSTAQDVADVMDEIEGVTNLKVDPQVLIPQIVVRPKPDAAASFGLSPGDIRAATTTLIRGTQVGEIFEDQKIFRVVVWGVEPVRRDVDALRTLMIDTPSGGQVPLGEIAEISIQPAANAIQREGTSRKLDVVCNVDGRDLGSVAQEIERRVLAEVTFPEGYHPKFLGEYAEALASRQRLLSLSGLSLLSILLLLHSDFGSMRLVWLVFLTLPFALIGGVAGAFLGGGIISLGSLIGFITVLGVAARNGIMLVDHYRHLQREEGVPFGVELVMRGAAERLAPILMTALTTGLALVPLVFTGNTPGQEIEYPMAFVILGGLVTSTLLNLFVLPPLFARLGNVDPSEGQSDPQSHADPADPAP
jgi:CzcA family heavy metal efflux pump